MTRSIIGVLAALALTLAACSGETPDPTPLSTAGSPTTALDVLATDALRFDPDQFTVPAGADITLTLTAEDGVEHDFVVAGIGGDGVAGGGPGGHMGDGGHGAHGGHGGHMGIGEGDLHVAHADAGETVIGTFRIDAPGSYEVYCSVPGHRQAGMTAQLHVVSA
jgi:uncharacterized cupredoxin-like copper-binding protein